MAVRYRKRLPSLVQIIDIATNEIVWSYESKAPIGEVTLTASGGNIVLFAWIDDVQVIWNIGTGETLATFKPKYGRSISGCLPAELVS